VASAIGDGVDSDDVTGVPVTRRRWRMWWGCWAGIGKPS